MTNAVLAPGLLMAVLACALGFLALRQLLIGAAFAIVVAVATVVIAPRVSPDGALLGCWASLILISLAVYWPGLMREKIAVPTGLCLIAGVWAGLVVSSHAAASTLPAVLAPLLLAILAYWCVRRGWAIAPRVVTSWLVAVALLAGSLPYLVEHPGYVSDHRM